jgi:tetratricopeptide (TPR) repeat protein
MPADRRSARLCAAAAVLAMLACGSETQRFARHLESADEYLKQGKHAEALLELRSALQIDPKNADVNVRIADAMVDQGRPADAAFYYREATRLDPKRADAALGEAKLVLFDDTDRAEELVKGVLEREPENVMAHVRSSEIALVRNDADAAVAAALVATEVDPDEPMAHMQLGISRLALVRRERLEGKTPSDELFQSAATAITRADELLGGGWKARAELAKLYAAWPNHEEQARETYRGAVEAAPEGQPRGQAAMLAASWARSTRDEEFLRWALEQVVAADPARLDAWEQLAALEERLEAGRAKAVYERLLAQRPADIEAHVRYARWLAATDQIDAALAHLEAQATEGLEPAVALEEAVAIALRRRRGERARSLVERLGREQPNHPRTLLARGRVALLEGRTDEGAELLRQYTSREERSEGFDLLARTELRRDNLPAATAAVDRAIQLTGGTPPLDLVRLKLGIHQRAQDWPQVLVTVRRYASLGYPLGVAERMAFVRALYESGRPQQGRQVLEQILAQEEAPREALLEFALREGRNDPERAEELVERVLAKDPENMAALQLVVAREVAEGRLDEALRRLDAVAEGRTMPPRMLLLRAQILAAKRDYARAEEDARRAFAAEPGLSGALDLLAGIYTAQGRIQEAIASFEEADRAGALPPAGVALLARLQFASGHRDEAEALYERALAGRADLPGAKNDLAWILAEKQVDLDRALTLAQESQQAEPESPVVVDTLGYVYYRKGLHEAAVQQFRLALELAERSRQMRPEFHFHLGLALRALDRQADAAAAFEKALSLGAFPEADQARRELEAARAASASPG